MTIKKGVSYDTGYVIEIYQNGSLVSDINTSSLTGPSGSSMTVNLPNLYGYHKIKVLNFDNYNNYDPTGKWTINY
ncbi:hypothetical protein D3C76_1685040 [compost metagenome]